MNININWNKIFLNIYPDDITKQFKKVFLPFYFTLSLVFSFIILNSQEIFFSNNNSLVSFFAYFILFPILLPGCIFGIICSTLHIIRKHNPLFLYYVNFKHFLLYVFSIGMFLPSVLFTFVYFTIILRILHLT